MSCPNQSRGFEYLVLDHRSVLAMVHPHLPLSRVYSLLPKLSSFFEAPANTPSRKIPYTSVHPSYTYMCSGDFYSLCRCWWALSTLCRSLAWVCKPSLPGSPETFSLEVEGLVCEMETFGLGGYVMECDLWVVFVSLSWVYIFRDWLRSKRRATLILLWHLYLVVMPTCRSPDLAILMLMIRWRRYCLLDTFPLAQVNRAWEALYIYRRILQIRPPPPCA